MSAGPSARRSGAIALLPELVRNQIAAGEVIERPASVVKELIENAIDAGARNVRVDLEEGGARLVRVTDDGAGMIPEDLELCFVPHATSKLREVGDLDHIASLGFRGEALASMGSVARCLVRSRTREASLGAEIENEGGRLRGPREAGVPVGTSVEVRDLFFNVPARRRFLKRPSTELGRCLDVIQRIALAQPGIGFVATHDDKRLFDVEASMDLRARVRRTFGAELADELEEVAREHDGLAFTGLVAPPRFARRDTARQMWFLNGRPLRDKLLLRLLKEGYRGFLVEGRQPVAFLSLSMDPAWVDVNVHPAKAEVRFREERRVFGFCVEAIREAVARTDMSTPGESLLASAARRLRPEEQAGQQVFTPPPRPLGARPSAPSAPFAVREVPGRPFEPPPRREPPTEVAPTASAEGAAPGEDELSGPYLQVARTYLLRALPDGFEIVDQHALHERVTYEDLRREVRRGRPEVQRLLVPDLVELSRAEVELLSGHLDALGALGIQLEPFGETTIAVQGLPARLRRPDAEGLVRDLVEVLERTGRPPEAEDVIEEVLHRAACRSSVMAGDELTQEEIRALLARGRALESDQTCPHARPTRVRFTLADLEKAFHRR